MGGITLAFARLNRLQAHSGASYAWVGTIFNRELGFLTGWTVLVSSVLFMVSAAIPAATATLLLVAPSLSNEKFPVIAVAACWLVAVGFVVVRGVHLTGRVQTAMTAIELLVLAGVAILAALRYREPALERLSWELFKPTAFSPGSFAAGAVVSLFFFWGWDVALNVSEETRESARTPGRAAGIAMVLVLAAFMSFAILTLAMLNESEIREAGTNLVFSIAERLLPRPWSYFAVLAVMLSSVGTLEASVVQFARTMFAKARAGELHQRWARVHERWRTPHLATYLISALGLFLLGLSLAFPTVDDLLTASVNALGLEVAFYYGLAAFACAWHFRKEARRSAGTLFLAVLFPAASALVLWITAAVAATSFDPVTLVIGIGGVLSGFVPLWLLKKRTAIAAGRTR